MDEVMRTKLSEAKDLAEVQSVLPGISDSDSEKIWEEIERHRSNASEKLDLDELDSVSGGADRDWATQGCAATVEVGSWCWSNDHCAIFDVTYDNLWSTCPDGHPHEFSDEDICVRCGIRKGTAVNPY